MEVDISHQSSMCISLKKGISAEIIHHTYIATVLAHTRTSRLTHTTHAQADVRAHTHRHCLYIILLVISTHIIFLFQFYAQLFARVWLASKNKVLRYIDEAKLALNVLMEI